MNVKSNGFLITYIIYFYIIYYMLLIKGHNSFAFSKIKYL